MDVLRDNYIKIIFGYYIFFLILIIYIPFTPGIIFLLFLPVVYISFLVNLKYSILMNILFLTMVIVYEMVGRNFILNNNTIILLILGFIASFVVVLSINVFKKYYVKKQQEISESMEQLAASYRSLETTQSKLMALTWITRELLGVQDKKEFFSQITGLLNKYMLYENIVFFSLKEGQFENMVQAGFKGDNVREIFEYIEIKPQEIDDNEVHIIDGKQKGTKIMYAPIFNGEDLSGILVILHKTDWINKEDKYIMNILTDHISLIFEKIKLVEDTHELAIKDGGTDLYNQRYFYKKLEKIFAKFREHGYSFSIIIFDIDNFKFINDNYGHLTGDRILEAMGQLITAHIRGKDILARYGGDEFVLILPMTDREISLKISERIVEVINNYEFVTEEGTTVNTSISGGIATYPDYDVDDPIEMVNQADQALYSSKRKGKNQVSY